MMPIALPHVDLVNPEPASHLCACGRAIRDFVVSGALKVSEGVGIDFMLAHPSPVLAPAIS
jgi:hypothetical protein